MSHTVAPNSTQPPALPQLAKPAPRIDALDLLRGIAILGIFLMNTWTMSLPQDAYTNAAAYNPTWVPYDSVNDIGGGFPARNTGGDIIRDAAGNVLSYHQGFEPLTGVNHWVYVAIHLFADMK